MTPKTKEFVEGLLALGLEFSKSYKHEAGLREVTPEAHFLARKILENLTSADEDDDKEIRSLLDATHYVIRALVGDPFFAAHAIELDIGEAARKD